MRGPGINTRNDSVGLDIFDMPPKTVDSFSARNDRLVHRQFGLKLASQAGHAFTFSVTPEGPTIGRRPC